jgi:hypothetical protein
VVGLVEHAQPVERGRLGQGLRPKAKARQPTEGVATGVGRHARADPQPLLGQRWVDVQGSRTGEGEGGALIRDPESRRFRQPRTALATVPSQV